MRHVLTSRFRALDDLGAFETADQVGQAPAPTRYAIRQAMDQEYQKYLLRKNADARQARYRAGGGEDDDFDGMSQPTDISRAGAPADGDKTKLPAVKRDFFGRVISVNRPVSKDEVGEEAESSGRTPASEGAAEERKVWVSFHEGFSNAVRKPITLEELMREF